MEINGYSMPDDLYYDEHHFWVRPDGDVFVMGMDDFAQKLAGEIVYVQLPDDGKRLKAGKKFAKVESCKWLGKVFAPFNGELETVNEDLETDPGATGLDSYINAATQPRPISSSFAWVGIPEETSQPAI